MGMNVAILRRPTRGMDALRGQLLQATLSACATALVMICAYLWISARARGIQMSQSAAHLYMGAGVLLFSMLISFLLGRFISTNIGSGMFIIVLVAFSFLVKEPAGLASGNWPLLLAVPIFAGAILIRPWIAFLIAGIYSIALALASHLSLHTLPSAATLNALFMFATVSSAVSHVLEQTVGRLRERNEQMELLLQASALLGESLDIDSIHRSLYGLLREHIKWDALLVAEFAREAELLVPVFAVQRDHILPAQQVRALTPLRVATDVTPVATVQSTDSRLVLDYDSWFSAMSVADANGSAKHGTLPGACLVAPMRLNGVLTGALVLQRRGNTSFAEDESQLLDALASQAAAARNNAVLYQESLGEVLERRRAELSQRASERRYQELFHRVPIALWEEDLSGVRRYINSLRLEQAESLRERLARDDAAAAECCARARIVNINDTALSLLPGYTKEEAMTAGWSALGSNARETFCESIVSLANGDLDHESDLIVTAADGSRRHLSVRLRPEPGAEDSWERMLVAAQDISETLRLEERLREAQKMEAVGRLAGGVAHDFNNILTVINGYSEFLLDAVAEDDPLRADILEVYDAGKRATRLTSQLLAFSRRQVMEARPLDINSLLQNLAKMLRRLIGEDVELIMDLDSELWQIHADPGQLEQIVMNLAVNARDAMPHGGRLSISTHNRWVSPVDCEELGLEIGGHVLLSVKDSGSGMPKSVLDHLFEPFFTTKERGKGTGLGLATVYGIVKQSSGAIAVDSEPGKGSEFRILFPRIGQTLLVDAQSPTPSPPRGSETIMLVEDEPSVRTLVASILRKLGYHVLESPNGLQALTLYSQMGDEIDLVLTDVIMPGMGGEDLRRQVQRSSDTPPFVFMSGYTDDALDRQRASSADVPIVPKPIDPDLLARQVRFALDASAHSQPVAARNWTRKRP